MVFSFNFKILLAHVALLALAMLLPLSAAAIFAVGVGAVYVTAMVMTNPPKVFNKATRAAYSRTAAKAWGAAALCWFYLGAFGLRTALATTFSSFAAMICCAGILYILSAATSHQYNKNADDWQNA